MKLNVSFFLVLFFSLKMYSQQVSNVLFTINDEIYYTSEFLSVCKKNNALIQNSNNTSIEDYLQLFVIYKLKVKEAKELGIDTLPEFKNELATYKEQLVLPYLKDKKVTNKLVKEAYKRLQKEVSTSHILITVKPNATPKDTLAAYQKIIEAQKLILAGEDFSVVAKKYSQDPSVSKKGGEIGYFTALQMVYQFENVAYSTKINEVSKPFRTKFGYHILKVNGIRPAKGEVEVAHIRLNNKSEKTKVKIDSIYSLILKEPSNFGQLAKELSDDTSSAADGGKLKRFGASKMVEIFSNVAFSLKNEGDISKPFQSDYGWHILKLLHKYPLQSFSNLEKTLTKKVESDARSELIGKSVVDSLTTVYNIEVNNTALAQFSSDNWKLQPENFKSTLLTIDNYKINQSDFINYLNSIRNSSIKDFEAFKGKQVLQYYTANIQDTNIEFSTVYKEFEEGMLLFEMLDKQVWQKSKDSSGLANYYKLNRATYNNKSLTEIKGRVISDYQNDLEELWVANLYEKYNVWFNEKEKKYILNTNIIE